MNNIPLSIIIPVYNVEKYIYKTLQSVKSQTLRPIEVIVVNDGSTDGTSQLAKQLLSGSNLVWKVIDQQNQGVSVARNTGIAHASGEYVHFLDGDDYIHETFAEKMYNTAKKYKSDIVFCKFDLVTPDGNIVENYDARYKSKMLLELSSKGAMSGIEILPDYLNGKIQICIGSAIYKKELLTKNNILYTPRRKSGEDTTFICKTLTKARNVSFVPETLAFYVQRPNSAVHGGIDSLSKAKDFLEVYYELEKFFELNLKPHEYKKIKQALANGISACEIFIIAEFIGSGGKLNDIDPMFFKFIKSFRPRFIKHRLLRLILLYLPRDLAQKVIAIAYHYYYLLKKKS